MHTLLSAPHTQLTAQLTQLERALKRLFPLRTAHRKDLPFAIMDLSRQLTTERSRLNTAYWSSPRLFSAYFHYFLPWNLLRLACLLPNLTIPLQAGDYVLDIGSGPLTMPLALWMSKPELRPVPLTIICTDTAPQPLEKGKLLFQAIAGTESPWRITTQRASIEQALRHKYPQKPALISAANVLNEIPLSRRSNTEAQFLDERMGELAFMMTSALNSAPHARMLLVEPGTRLGGKLISLFRAGALTAGFSPLAPCPHNASCPMLEEYATSWCHFTLPPSGAPTWLIELTRRAKLEKNSLSLATLFLQPAEAAAPQKSATLNQARIISDPILIPTKQEKARYACSEKGLTLVHNAARMASGTLVTIHWPERETRDAKSGALEAELAR